MQVNEFSTLMESPEHYTFKVHTMDGRSIDICTQTQTKEHKGEKIKTHSIFELEVISASEYQLKPLDIETLDEWSISTFYPSSQTDSNAMYYNLKGALTEIGATISKEFIPVDSIYHKLNKEKPKYMLRVDLVPSVTTPEKRRGFFNLF